MGWKLLTLTAWVCFPLFHLTAAYAWEFNRLDWQQAAERLHTVVPHKRTFIPQQKPAQQCRDNNKLGREERTQHSTHHHTPKLPLNLGREDSPPPSSALTGYLFPFSKGKSMEKKQLSTAARNLAGSSIIMSGGVQHLEP